MLPHKSITRIALNLGGCYENFGNDIICNGLELLLCLGFGNHGSRKDATSERVNGKTPNFTELTYDGTGRLAKIVETTSGSVTSTKQLIRCGNKICEERDATGAVVAKFLALGERVGSTNYFYELDHLGSIIGVVNSSGAEITSIRYDAWGKPTISGSYTPSFGFVDMYLHQRSGLNLTLFRAYSSNLSRWLSRDKMGEKFGNIYAYCVNNPISFVDPTGLRALTSSEKQFVRDNFGGCLDPDQLEIKPGPLGDVGISPPGNDILFLSDVANNELNLSRPSMKEWFAHELWHKVQYQMINSLSRSPRVAAATYVKRASKAWLDPNRGPYDLPADVSGLDILDTTNNFERGPQAVGKAIRGEDPVRLEAAQNR